MKRLSIASSIVLCFALAVVIGACRSESQDGSAAKFNEAVALLDGYRGDTASLERARTDLDDVLKARPRYAPAHREMARYLIMRGYINSQNFRPGSLEAAEASLDKAIEIDPNYAQAFVLRGHLYHMMGRNQDALAALEKAEALGATDPWLQNNWADLLMDEGKHEEAAVRYRKVVDSKTTNKKAMTSAFEGLIRYYRNIGDLDRADEMFKKQIAFEPGSAWPYGNHAQFLLCERDDFEGSIARSREALRIMDYGMARYWLASALYRKWAENVLHGKPDQGSPYFAEAQAIYPDPHEIAADARSCRPLGLVGTALKKVEKESGATPRAQPASGLH